MAEYNLRPHVETPIKVDTAYLWDFPKMDLRLNILDGRMYKGDGYVCLYASCDFGVGFKRKEDVKWEWKKGEVVNLMLQFHAVQREETDYKTKEKKVVEPSLVEKYMAWVAERYDGLPFKGYLMLNENPRLQIIIDGKDGDEVVSPERLDMLSGAYADFRISPNPEQSIWTDELVQAALPKAYGSKSGGTKSAYGGSKAQTEYERLKDREKWLMEALSALPYVKFTSFAEVVNSRTLSIEEREFLKDDLDFLLKFMNK